MTRRNSQVRPPPIMLANYDTLQTFEIDGRGILAPVTGTENTTVKFADVAPFGLSHTRQQYSGTGNRSIPLVFRVAVKTKPDMDKSRLFLRFCQSFAYAPGSATDDRVTGPPVMLVAWPKVMSGLFRLRSLVITRTNFNKEGEMVDGSVALTLSEYLERQITHEDVLEQGSFRIKLI